MKYLFVGFSAHSYLSGGVRQRGQMPKIHKIMFGAGIIMWMLSSAHLGLVIQQVTNVETPLRNAQAQVSIATIQVNSHQ